MKKLLTALDLEAISMGSTIFATGGAFSFDEQKRLLEGFKPFDSKVTLWSIDEFPPDATFATVYGVGAAGASPDALEALIPKALELVQKRVKKNITGIFPGETGIEAFLFRAVSKLGIPVLDADGTGGRAVPEVRIDNFILQGVSTLPLFALRDDGAILQIDDSNTSGSALEAKIRNFSLDGGSGSVLVLDHLCSPKLAAANLTLGTISRSLTLGKALQSATPLSEVLNAIDANFMGKFTIIKSELARKNGFLAGNVYLENQSSALTVEVKNENLRVRNNDKTIIQAPQLIFLIDELKRTAVHNAEIIEKQQVLLYTLKPESRWATKKAEEFFWAA
jgi:DUF917 family protein